MLDIHSRINNLRRPNLLVRAARFGVDAYNRTVLLARYLSVDPAPSPASVLMQLFEIERDMNNARLAKAGRYQVSRHIDVLVAIMAEAQLLRAASQPRLVASDPV